MKNIKFLISAMLLASFFIACSSDPKSVDYYKDPKNAKELEAKIKECKKNANSEFTDQECANAYKANFDKSVGKTSSYMDMVK